MDAGVRGGAQGGGVTHRNSITATDEIDTESVYVWIWGEGRLQHSHTYMGVRRPIYIYNVYNTNSIDSMKSIHNITRKGLQPLSAKLSYKTFISKILV